MFILQTCLFQEKFSDSVGDVCNTLSSVSSQQKFEARDGPVSQLMLQLFYLESKGKYILPRGMGAGSRLTQKTGREEEPPAQFRLLFLYVFCFFPSLLPLGLPCVNWASQEGCLFNLKSSLGSSDLPLFHFHRLFPSLFSHCHFGPIFPILTNNSAKK